jgi:aryl-alcohol dehydrogenase-like predicted oxidoreductase
MGASAMIMRRLGINGPEISSIGLGCMGMSGNTGARAHLSDDEGIATIQAAIDAGINFLDTGDYYGMGHNETIVGRALKDRRSKALISVKFGALKSPSGQIIGVDVSPKAVKNFAAYSLQRLGIDVIDIYQPGRIDPDIPVEDTVGAIADLIKEGKVRYLGLSEAGAENLRRAHKVHPVTALEIEYSMGSRFIEKEILPTARELGTGIVAYGVVAHGLLTGGLKSAVHRSDAGWPNSRYSGENLKQNLEMVDALETMAIEKGIALNQLALAWILSRGDDVIALMGMSSRSRIQDNLKALDVVLSRDELLKIDRIIPGGEFLGERYPPSMARLTAN